MIDKKDIRSLGFKKSAYSDSECPDYYLETSQGYNIWISYNNGKWYTKLMGKTVQIRDLKHLNDMIKLVIDVLPFENNIAKANASFQKHITRLTNRCQEYLNLLTIRRAEVKNYNNLIRKLLYDKIITKDEVSKFITKRPKTLNDLSGAFSTGNNIVKVNGESINTFSELKNKVEELMRGINDKGQSKHVDVIDIQINGKTKLKYELI